MGRKKKKKAAYSYKNIDRSEAEEYDYHLPVLRDKTIEYLITESNAFYVDGTLGGGGHAAEIMKRLDNGGKLLAFDKDEEAISHCRAKFKEELDKGENSRIALFNNSFEESAAVEGIKGRVMGILLDLGVSSMQLDSETRGFSYRVETALDMRFSSGGPSAEQLLNEAKEDELAWILQSYGEEPYSKPLARRICELRRATPLKTTQHLRRIVEEIVPESQKYKALSRVFQAIRIAINDELEVLKNTIIKIVPILAKGGRIVIISYHSLEDRIVKQLFREISRPVQEGQANKFEFPLPALKLLTKKPILPDAEELKRNPRSRSAKLRIAKKIID